MRKIFAILSVFLCLACSDVDVRATLEHIETFIVEHPDSALTVLDSVDRSLLSVNRDRAHHALLYAMALDKSFIDVKDDSIARVAVDYYSEHGPDKYYARSLYYLGLAYYYQGAYDKAILEFTKAERIAKVCDTLYWGMSVSFQADAYDKTYNNDEEINCLKKAYDIYGQIPDKYKMQAVNLRLALSYSSMFKYEEAEEIFLSMIQSPDVDSLIKQYASRGYAFMNVSRSDLHTALAVYDGLVSAKSKVMSRKDYWAYAYALYEVGREKEANAYISFLNDKAGEAKYWLYLIKKKQGRYEDALRFLEESNIADKDAIRKTLSQSLSIAQRNYYLSQYELADYKSKNRIKTIIIIVVVSLLIVFVVLWICLRLYRLREEEKERYLHYADEIHRQLAEARRHDYPSLKKKYLDLYRSRFETIGALYEQYSISYGKDNAEHHIYEKVVSIVSAFRKEYAETEELEAMLDSDMDNLISNLRSELGKIKKVDVTIFCFLVIGFDVTTISHLMNVSMNTIYIRKSRLKQRIEKASSEHKDQFLELIS